MGYLPHFFNFKCFLDRLNMNFLTIVLDEETHTVLSNRTDLNLFPLYDGVLGKTTTAATSWALHSFNVLTSRKLEAVLLILKAGYHVLFSDADIAILRDPFPYILWRNVDYVHSQDSPCWEKAPFSFYGLRAGNSGFYFIRSNANTIKLYEIVIDHMMRSKGLLDDQDGFWRVFKTTENPLAVPLGPCSHYDRELTQILPRSGDKVNVVVTCALDHCVFPPGAFIDYSKYMKISILKS
eukprot:gene24390-29485_t